jgi:amino-acid N-acetyltransferase
MSASIRSATPDDWGPIRSLLLEAGLPTEDLAPSAYAQFRIYQEGSRIKGTVALERLDPATAMLRSLVVGRDDQGNGIGKALVEDVERLARSTWVDHVFLLTTSADRFFAKLGYQRIERDSVPDEVKAHEQFRSLCPASAVIMSKRV